MRFLKPFVIILGISIFLACSKKEEDESEKFTIQPQLLRLPVADTVALNKRHGPHLIDPADETSLMQSFTPTSIKLSVYDIAISTGDGDDWNGPGNNIYKCAGATNEECMIEVSDLKGNKIDLSGYA